MQSFLQLSFALGRLTADAVEAGCFELGALSVTFVDSKDNPVLEPLPGEFRLWPDTTVRALFDATAGAEVIVSQLGASLGLTAEAVRVESVADRVWEREWLRDFHAMRFGRRLWICPHHEQVSDPGAVVVRMDPGLAFGTGTHPTTALCLEWLDANVVDGQCVIDFGCGSGILAVAAVKLGAREAHCFDIDPQALLAARENALANAVETSVKICHSADALPQGADVLVANILSGPLCELAPTFASLVRAGGSIVLAGLLEDEAGDVTQACNAWFDMRSFGCREGWVRLSGKRNTHALRGERR
jgi:ribosomal protein L11 methyltransferase